ncbi:MAG: Cna B-type domain-containing protein [Christensenellaceae bacterium]|nr:Cna B-type domain-containing protein [Christensenellaceae bacterium]
MNKYLKAVLSLLCAIVMACYVPIIAADAMPESCSLTLEYIDEDAGPLDGCTFRLYHIADGNMNDYRLMEEFIDKQEEVDQVDWYNAEDVADLAVDLSEYITNDDIEPAQTGTTDQEGRLSFNGLSIGLYLTIGDQLSKDGWIYTPQPTLIWLPCVNPDGGLDYDPVCTLKYEKTPEEVKPETISIFVEKVWVDDGNHPSSVTVQLLCDGEVYDEVTLNAENDWRYTWENLEADHDWQIVETDIPDGYTARVTRDGFYFTVTNTKKLPQTGQLWWPVPAMLGAGLLLLIFGVVLRKRGRSVTNAD